MTTHLIRIFMNYHLIICYDRNMQWIAHNKTKYKNLLIFVLLTSWCVDWHQNTSVPLQAEGRRKRK
jgi:hypothetical protein